MPHGPWQESSSLDESFHLFNPLLSGKLPKGQKPDRMRMINIRICPNLVSYPKKRGRNEEEYGGCYTWWTDIWLFVIIDHCSCSTLSVMAYTNQRMTQCGRLASISHRKTTSRHSISAYEDLHSNAHHTASSATSSHYRPSWAKSSTSITQRTILDSACASAPAANGKSTPPK